LGLEYAKYLVKPLLAVFILGCAAVEIVSNRHFYYVLADFTMDAESGWYRARLIDVAVMKLPEYWRFGYGFADPGWAPLLDGNKRTDGVNDYVVHAILYGLFGLIAYVSVLARAVYNACRCLALSRSPWVRSCAWALASALIGLLFAFWSVSLFGQMITVFYFLLGLHGALGVAIEPARAIAPASRAASMWGPRRTRVSGFQGRQSVS
jgi:hypothetical protein